MAEVGELTWIAEIQEIADAKRDAEQMNEGLEGLADQARETEEAMDGVGDSSGGLSDSFGGLGRNAGFLVGGLSLLGGELLLLILRMAGVQTGALTLIGALKGLYAWVAAGGITGAISTLLGYASTFIGWLAAGSAGALAFAAAIGVVVGLIGVWILKITGVLDWIGQLGAMLGEALPGWARDALLAVISIFAGGLAVLGGVILGFMEGGLQGAIERGSQVLQIFAGAWGRLWKGVKQTASEFIGDIVGMLQGFGEDAAEYVTGAARGIWNAAIPDTFTLPEISVGGQHIGVNIPHVGEVGGTLPEITLGGDVIDLPQLQSGGMIEEEGAFVGHAGEMVLPADVSRDVIAALRSGGSGGGSAGASVNIEQQTIEIGDQQIDVSQLDRTTLEVLASLIAEKQGDELAALV